MMGTKIRNFAPLTDLSLVELVPKDHFYRRLEATLDLSFVRDLVRDCYASSGRPSVDPVVFFRLQLVIFFEDIRSERQLMEVAADRLSIRWYLGYDLREPLPNHSSLMIVVSGHRGRALTRRVEPPQPRPLPHRLPSAARPAAASVCRKASSAPLWPKSASRMPCQMVSSTAG